MRKELLKTLSQNRIVSILLLVLVASHFLFLNVFPAGLNHDEIEKVLSVSSFIEWGVDISGVSFPKALILSNTSGGQNNFVPFVLSFVFRVIPLTSTTVRIPFILLSLFTGILVSNLVWKLTNNRRFSLAVLFVSLINPWMWFLSRNITEATFALFFVVLGIWCLELRFWKMSSPRLL